MYVLLWSSRDLDVNPVVGNFHYQSHLYKSRPNSPDLLLFPQILQEIEENGIKIYKFPDSEGDEEEAAANKKLRVIGVK